MASRKIPWRRGLIDDLAAQATPDGRLSDATQGAERLICIIYRTACLYLQHEIF